MGGGFSLNETCPACGGLDLETEGGDELILEAIHLEEQDVSRHPG